MNKRKGISLIVLVITILVMIILAGVVVVSLQKNNPIENAKKARVMTDITTFKQEYEQNLASMLVNNEGEFQKSEINASTYEEMKKYIPSITQKYSNNLQIKKGEICFSSDIEDFNLCKYFFDCGLVPDIYNKDFLKGTNLKNKILGVHGYTNPSVPGDLYMADGTTYDTCIFAPSINNKDGRLSINQVSKNNDDGIIFENCHFKGKFFIDSHNAFLKVTFNNCTFDNAIFLPKVHIADNDIPSNVTFNNCKINVKDNHLIRVGNFGYERGDLNITFNNCTIKSEGNKMIERKYLIEPQSLIYFDAIPTSGNINFVNTSITKECLFINNNIQDNKANDLNIQINYTNSTIFDEIPENIKDHIKINIK